MSEIRQRELKTVWTKGLDPNTAHQADEILYPGVMFHLAKGRMEKTDLWRIVERMPKGSLLHAHMEAMFDIDFLVDQALSTPGMHIHAPHPVLSRRDFEEAPVECLYVCLPAEKEEVAKPVMWAADYEPSSLVPIKDAAASFPAGGEAGFREWMKSRCMIMPEHSYNHYHGVDAIWAIFQRTFLMIRTIVFYEPILRNCLRRLLRQLMDDGVRYVDFRIGFKFDYRREGSNVPEDGYTEFCRVFKDEVERFKATEEGQDFYGARIIWTTLRRFDDEEIVDSMKECILAKLTYPDVICGFDLVGQEDQGRPLVDMIPILFWFRKRCVEEGVDIPFLFHAGECLGDGDETDNNLFDAILLGTRRIGHGFSLFKHPLLIELVKERRILIECCPVSNEILRLTSSIKSHPLPALLANGVSVSLCNDDPAILGHGKNGLSHDFWQSLQGLENMGIEGLAQMAENSIRWSCYEDKSGADWADEIRKGIMGHGLKAARLREWYADFEAFCVWVVSEFGEDEDEEESDGETGGPAN